MVQMGDGLSSERLMMFMLEKIKSDIERLYPTDDVSKNLINELLYRFAWKVKDAEIKSES